VTGAAARRGAVDHSARAEGSEPWPRGVSREPAMKIGEVVDRLKAEFPALSVSKVRYLEAEGLISPHRVGNGYRRYSVADMERLRYTLTAQRDEYLPLSVIRERLTELDGDMDAPPPAPVARVVASDGRTVAGAFDADDLVHHSGASLAQIEELVTIGIIVPDAHGRFDSRALTTVSLALRAGRLGVPLRNLRTVRSAAEREADAIELATQHKRSRSTTAGEDAAAELAGVLAQLHTSLLHHAVEALR